MLQKLLTLFKKKKSKNNQLEVELETSLNMISYQVSQINQLITNTSSKEIYNSFEAYEEIFNILEDIRSKVDEIYYILKREREIKRLTGRDIEILKLLLEKGELTAEDVADMLNISRSTASLRLNKLYSMGYLNKFIKDRKVYFFVKDEDSIKKIIEEANLV